MTYSIHWYACTPIDLGRQFARDPTLIEVTIRKVQSTIDLSQTDLVRFRAQ